MLSVRSPFPFSGLNKHDMYWSPLLAWTLGSIQKLATSSLLRTSLVMSVTLHYALLVCFLSSGTQWEASTRPHHHVCLKWDKWCFYFFIHFFAYLVTGCSSMALSLKCASSIFHFFFFTVSKQRMSNYKSDIWIEEWVLHFL